MNILDIYKIIKNKGISWTIFRTKYEIGRRTGVIKNRFPVNEISNRELLNRTTGKRINTIGKMANEIRTNKNRFFINSESIDICHDFLESTLNKAEKDALINIADRAIDGKIFCFSRWEADYGKPINWHLNPVTGYEWPKDKHWVDLEELSKESGDVKYVWEASRFPQFYYFVRAYALTNNEKYAKAYWEQVESWIAENPYNLGINWKCGQEIAFRMFAWIFGLHAFLDSSYSTDERIFILIKNLYQSVIRIENNIDFAIKAVQNNHSISEAAGLFTFGILFPFFKESERLLIKGKTYLEQEGLKQIYNDGSYIQNSMNYHRLMLQDFAWCYRLAELNGHSFSIELTDKINKSVYFLYQMQEEKTGMLPNYGANDGALIFPLSVCDYLDYRPQINTVYYILNNKRLYEPGIYDEGLLWFCGLDAVKDSPKTDIKRISEGFEVGGYYTFRNGNFSGMIKCGNHKKRPSPGDMLHFDLWYKGTNILCDVGSYSYNPEKSFRNYFRATKNHNTVTINDQDQAKRGPRFLTIDWPNGYTERFENDGQNIYFSGYHDAYDNIHAREIEFKKDFIIVTDTIRNTERENIKIRLNWNIGTSIEKLDDNKFRLKADDETIILELSSTTKGSFKLYFGDINKPAGWRSLYYGEMLPMNQLVYEVFSREHSEKIVTRIYTG